MKKCTRSLSVKVLFGISVILLPIFITFFLIYKQNKAYLKKHILDDITILAEFCESHMYQFLEAAKLHIQNIANDGFVKNQLLMKIRGKKLSVDTLSKHLVKNKLPLYKDIKVIYILSSDGHVVASTNNSEIGRDVSCEAFFIKGKDAVSFEEHVSGYNELPDLIISSPIFDKDTDKCIGVIVGFIQISGLNKILSGESVAKAEATTQKRKSWKTMEVYLVNRDKRVIAEFLFMKDTILKRMVDTLPVNMCLTENKEISGIYKDYRGREVMGASIYFPSMKWVLLVEINKDEVFVPVKKMLIGVLITAVVVTVLVICLFIGFIKKVVKPLRIISNAARYIACGAPDVAIPVQTGDEIGLLCESFNNMAHSIKMRTSALAKSESSLAKAQWIARLGNWEWDITKNEACWSDEAYRIFGLIPQECNITFEKFLHYIHPDDREFARKSIDEALNKKGSCNFGFRIISHDAAERFVHVMGEVEFDGTGKTARMIGTIQDITERKHMEGQLQKLSCAIEQSSNMIIITDTTGNIQYVNPKFTELTGYSTEEVIGKNPCILKSGKTSREEYKRLWRTISSGGKWRGEFLNKKKNGDLYWEIANISPVKNKEGIITHFIEIAEDITNIKRAEESESKLKEQLYHVQKLESIGTLAGGIAHDFNNILAIIMGYGNLLQNELEKDNSLMVYIQKILASTERAANLTKGLLTFSRKQKNNPKPVNLNEVIKRVESLMVRLIGEDIQLKTIFIDKNCIVMADSNQIEQVLMNLVTNARDAMPNGGSLTIITEVVELDSEFIKIHGYGMVGKYVLVSISDTGIGMGDETKKRIFEPFFTTKEVGKGTGLGLSIVYGIVKQHQGYINVDSELGKGSIFKMYIPVIETVVDEIESEMLITKGGKETILLAEDEKEVRILIKIVLQKAGYKIIEAVDGDDIIRKFIDNKNKIHCLIVDVIMPIKDGKAAYDVIRQMAPDIKALFISGYSEEVINKKDILKEGLHFIPKPILPNELLRKVREVLEV